MTFRHVIKILLYFQDPSGMYMEKNQWKERQWKFGRDGFSLKFDHAAVLQPVNFRDLRWNLTGPSMSGTAMWSTTARRQGGPAVS